MNIEGKLNLLIDIESIKQSKARYLFLTDKIVETRDPHLIDQMAELFTEDAIVEYGKVLGSHNGRAAIKKLFGELIPGRRSWCWYSAHSPLIDINGDRATAMWTVHAIGRGHGDAAGRNDAFVGRYFDEHVRTATGFRQSHLRFEVHGL